MTDLDYQELVNGYYDNLNNNLRNFKGGPGFLETWVHDEDHNRSLLEILDLAHSHGIERLNIQLPATVTSTINLDWLKRNASEFGSLELKGESLTFSNAKGVVNLDEFGGLSENYLDGVKRHSEALAHEGPLNSKDLEIYTAVSGAGRLNLAVDDKGVVLEAKHQGFEDNKTRALMDAFCSVLINRSLHEGAEHGAIRLEVLLRDPKRPLKVKGLLTPETADPIFETPSRLVRQIWNQYVTAKKLEPQRNFWRDPVPATWLALSADDRLKQAQMALTEGSRHYALQEDVLVTEIKNDTRFVLSYKQNPEFPDFGRHMIKLERWLREKLGLAVELQLESIEDRNRREERTKRN